MNEETTTSEMEVIKSLCERLYSIEGKHNRVGFIWLRQSICRFMKEILNEAATYTAIPAEIWIAVGVIEDRSTLHGDLDYRTVTFNKLANMVRDRAYPVGHEAPPPSLDDLVIGFPLSGRYTMVPPTALTEAIHTIEHGLRIADHLNQHTGSLMTIDSRMHNLAHDIRQGIAQCSK